MCRESGYTAWRDRVLTPVTTMPLFLLQMLQGHPACRHLPHLSGRRVTAAASCQARARLPRRCFDRLWERFRRAVQRSALDEGRWHGHRTCLAAGSGGSRPESAGPPGRVRPPDGAAARVRRSRRAAPGAVACRPQGAPDAGGRTPPHPRSRPGAGGPPGLPPGRRARRRPGPVVLRPSGPPRAGWRARRPARVGATARGCHPRSALGPAPCAAAAGRHRTPTLPRAPHARCPCPTRHLVDAADVSLLAHPGSVGRPARDVSAPRGARSPRPPRLPKPPDHLGDHAPRRGHLRCGRPRRPGPTSAGRSRPRWRTSRPRCGGLWGTVKPDRACCRS
jgi:hypothetical protein